MPATLTREPFLSRSAGDGIVIALDWNTPEEVVLTIHHGKIVLDVKTLPTSKALDAFHHPQAYSDKLAEALT